jgi:hypothetical protein
MGDNAMPKIGSVDVWFSRNTHNVLLVMALMLMCLCEQRVIRGVWLRPGGPSDLWNAILLPILVLFPALFGLTIRLVLKRPLNVGQISLPMAGQVNVMFGAALLTTYLAMQMLAEMAFG